MRNLSIAIILVIFPQMVFAAGGASSGSDGGNSLLLETLNANGTITAKQYEEIKRQMVAKKPAAAQATSEQKPESNGFLFAKKGGRFRIKSDDGTFEFEAGGRVMVDTDSFSISNNPSPGVNSFGNGTEIRRARMFIAGKIYRDWKYKVQYDFTGSGASGLKDAFIQYNGFDLGDKTPVTIRLGNTFEQFGLEPRTSSKYQSFQELALPSQALAPGPRHLGLETGILHGPFVFGAGIYGAPPGSQSNLANGDAGYSVDSRLVYDPLQTKTQLLHFGASARYHKYNSEPAIGNRNDGVLAARPGAHLAPALIAARVPGSLPDHENSYNAEFAAIQGPFSIQAEYFLARISGVHNVRQGSPVFDGYYAQLGWFLTGESRKYVHSPQYANFAQVKPNNPLGKGGYGAFKLAARVDNADLNDGDIRGGDETNFTFGVNWFPNSNLRFQANYVRSLSVKGGPFDGIDYNALVTRATIYF